MNTLHILLSLYCYAAREVDPIVALYWDLKDRFYIARGLLVELVVGILVETLHKLWRQVGRQVGKVVGWEGASWATI